MAVDSLVVMWNPSQKIIAIVIVVKEVQRVIALFLPKQ